MSVKTQAVLNNIVNPLPIPGYYAMLNMDDAGLDIITLTETETIITFAKHISTIPGDDIFNFTGIETGAGAHEINFSGTIFNDDDAGASDVFSKRVLYIRLVYDGILAVTDPYLLTIDTLDSGNNNDHYFNFSFSEIKVVTAGTIGVSIYYEDATLAATVTKIIRPILTVKKL